jgi:4-amino-4-deoxy-L-arabinose transferase-like glycosyltransferase
MRTLIIVNLVIAGLLVICFWPFALFTHGAFVNRAGLAAGILCGFAMLPLLPCVPVLLLVNIYGVFKYWSKHKLVTLVPFLVLGTSVIGVIGLWALDVSAMSIRRFEKYLPDYEAFVKIAEQKHKLGDWDVMPMPKGYKHLGYLAVIYDDKPISDNDPNIVFVSFEVGHFGVFGHTHFLHSSNGEIARGSKAYREWRNRRRVNEHWFRVSD